MVTLTSEARTASGGEQFWGGRCRDRCRFGHGGADGGVDLVGGGSGGADVDMSGSVVFEQGGGHLGAAGVVHADQYSSKTFARFCQRLGVTQSMGAVGTSL